MKSDPTKTVSLQCADIKNESEADAFISYHSMKYMRKKGLPWILAIFSIVIILLFLLLCFVMFSRHVKSKKSDFIDISLASFWASAKPESALARFRKAAVVSDHGLCSEIGRFYGKCSTIDARETAPLATDETIFFNNSENAFLGYKSIAVPGEVNGFWQAYKRFGSGRINWQDLILPTIQHLTNGYPISKLMENNLYLHKDKILSEQTMKDFFTNKATGKLYREGEIIYNLQLAETLRQVATSADPIRYFYTGEFAKQISNEIMKKGGLITLKDLEKYKAIVSDSPLESVYFNKNNKNAQELVMCGPKAPSSFAITQLIFSIMTKFFPISANLDRSIPYTSVDYYHKFIEAQKFAFAFRAQLNDGKFNTNSDQLTANLTKPELIDEIANKIQDKILQNAVAYLQVDQQNTYQDIVQQHDNGASHISVIDADGNAVSLTSSINNVFGSIIRSEKTGIVWNDQLDDFSIQGLPIFSGFEPSKINFVLPGKRPLSSMSPLILFNKNTKNVKLSVGGAGGLKIISAIAQVLLQNQIFGHSVKEAIDTPRIHNQFTPFVTEYENGFSTAILEGLKERGQNITLMNFPFATVSAISRDENNTLLANSDHRRPVYTYPTGY